MADTLKRPRSEDFHDENPKAPKRAKINNPNAWDGKTATGMCYIILFLYVRRIADESNILWNIQSLV